MRDPDGAAFYSLHVASVSRRVAGISDPVSKPSRTPEWLADLAGFELPHSAAKNAFEISRVFPLFGPKTRVGDSCSCEMQTRPKRTASLPHSGIVLGSPGRTPENGSCIENGWTAVTSQSSTMPEPQPTFRYRC